MNCRFSSKATLGTGVSSACPAFQVFGPLPSGLALPPLHVEISAPARPRPARDGQLEAEILRIERRCHREPEAPSEPVYPGIEERDWQLRIEADNLPAHRFYLHDHLGARDESPLRAPDPDQAKSARPPGTIDPAKGLSRTTDLQGSGNP
jgi:hypothetical protein